MASLLLGGGGGAAIADPAPSASSTASPTASPTASSTASPTAEASPVSDAGARQAESTGPTISGRVTLPGDVAPTEGAVTVQAWSLSQTQVASANVGDDGRYVVEGLATGTYKLRFVAPGLPVAPEWWNDSATFASATRVELGSGSRTDIDVTLAAEASISGTVALPADVAAMDAPVQVYAFFADGQFGGVASVGADGGYRIGSLLPGDYKIRFSPATGVPLLTEWWNDVSDERSAAAIAVAEGAAVTGVDATLTRTGSISGRITLPSGIRVGSGRLSVVAYDTTHNQRSVSDVKGNGTYSLIGLPAGEYRVFFAVDRVPVVPEWWNDKPSFDAADAIVLAEGEKRAAVDATLDSAASISGTVTLPDGIAAPDVSVSLYGPDGGWIQSAQPGLDGKYTIGNLAAGTYKLFFTSSSAPLLSEWWNDKPDIASADTVIVAWGQKRTGIDATLARKPRISGHVSVPSGIDVSNGKVIVWAYDAADETRAIASARVASDGSYAITSLQPGSYKVTFTAPGLPLIAEWWDDRADFASAATLTLRANESRDDVDATLAAGATITGRVTVPTGLGGAVAGLAVTAHAVDGSVAATARTAADGTYRLTGLSSGSYRLRFDAGSLPVAAEWAKNATDFTSATPVVVWNQQVRSGVNAYLDRPSSISGTVTLPSGTAFEPGQMRVKIYTAGRDLAGEAAVATDGSYTVTGLALGTYHVLFDAEGLPVADEWWSDRASFETAEPITLSAREAKGNVDAVLSGSAPVSAARADALVR